MDNPLPNWIVTATEEMADFDLREWRQRLDLTQAQAAAALGVTREQVGRWERGQGTLDLRTRLACQYLENYGKAVPERAMSTALDWGD